MVTMDLSLADMYKRGIITLETAQQRAMSVEDLRTLLGKMV